MDRFRLKIGLAHAIGAALGAVLRLLLYQVPARLAAEHGGIRSWQGPARQGFEQGNGHAASFGQPHTGNKASSARYGLEGIGPENHG